MIDFAMTAHQVYGDVQDGGVEWEDAGAYTVMAIDALRSCRTGKPDEEGSSCPVNSFDADTPVLMSDGSQKPIDKVQEGDVVWSENPETHVRGPRKVTATIVGDGMKRLVAITVITAFGLSTLIATDGHPFWLDSRRSWVEAAELRPDDLLKTPDDDHVRVSGIRIYEEEHEVYNLTVEDLHTYFVGVGRQAVLVHNHCGKSSWHATRLENNMAAAGRPRPGDGYHASHIVASSHSRAAKGPAALDRLGIDVDDEVNGIWLSPSENLGMQAWQFDRINKVIETASSRGEAERLLRALGAWLRDGGRP